MPTTRDLDASTVTQPARPAARPREWAVAAAAGAAGLLTVGCALLAVGHAGVRLPLVSALGPGGGRAVPVAAVAFTVGAIAYGLVTRGLLLRARWAWLAGLVLGALTVVGAVQPFRGVGSAVGVALALVVVGALASPAGRRAFAR